MLVGLLLAISFPNIGVAGLAWIAPGLLLALAIGRPGGERFRIGYFAGLAHYLASLYWLLLIPVRGFPILGWVALSAFLALYPATWVWLATGIARLSRPVPSGTSPAASRATPFRELARWNWPRRTLWAAACAAVWVSLEMIVARLLGGFPWNLLGASQYRIIPLIQIASLTGVYGVSFLVAWTSVSLLSAVAMIISFPNERSFWMREMFLPLAVIGATLLFGFHQLSRPIEPARQLKVTLIQPSIPQTLIWNPDNDLERFHELLALSEQALTNDTDVLIWPEAAVPGLPRYQAEIAQPILALARAHKIWMIIGADDAEATPAATNYYNASFLISPEGRLVEVYRKRSLVMFGEYIPLVRWLPFVKWLTPVTGSYTPGDRAVQFTMQIADASTARAGPLANGAVQPAESSGADSFAAQTSPLICFEDNFPHRVRECAGPNTDFLVNLTNNGWFDESAAQWQHAANAIFRSVENGLPLVRCSNNGLTCWVDTSGRIREMFRDRDGSIYGKGFLTARIPLLASGGTRVQTFYNRHGDWFGWGCVILGAVCLLPAKLRN